MKKTVLAFALAAASLNAAQAQTVAPEAAPSAKSMRFLIGAGVTFGGDKLATASYTNGTESNIHAGGVLALNAGIDYRINQAFSVQGTVGYHVDDSSPASNGSISFHRFPLELLGYYHVSPQWRVGGGLRYVTNAKLSSSGAAYIGDYEFDNTTGGVIEGEYLFGPKLGFKVRYVNESYKAKLGGDKIDGSHFGLLLNYYF